MRFVGIDPSTKTGFVEMDEKGNVLQQIEIQLPNGINSTDQEMLDYGSRIVKLIQPGSVICVEDFSYGSTGSAVSTQYGVGYAIRYCLIKNKFTYYKPTPSQLKKYGSGKGNTPKDALAVHIFKEWGFEHKSDNVRDAFILAHIARALSTTIAVQVKSYQLEVLQALRNPTIKKKTK